MRREASKCEWNSLYEEARMEREWMMGESERNGRSERRRLDGRENARQEQRAAVVEASESSTTKMIKADRQ